MREVGRSEQICRTQPKKHRFFIFLLFYLFFTSRVDMSKPGAGALASASVSNQQRRERLAQLGEMMAKILTFIRLLL